MPVFNAPAALVPRSGLLVADKYELLHSVGRGGMGEVWKARHRVLGHEVAVKFLSSERAGESALCRFQREAVLAARFGEMSRHIVRAFDCGVAPLGHPVPFAVMELLTGESLADRLKREGSLPVTAVVRVVTHLCKALRVAHAFGVVHRDVKPGNVFLARSLDDDDFVTKLLDFGVAQGSLPDDEHEPSGSLFGTLGYMSPEQLLGEPNIDGRSDLWAVGVLTYRMAVGKSPFAHGPQQDLIARVLGADPKPPSSENPALPATFDGWCVTALAKRPEQRFADAEQMSRELCRAFGLDPEPVVGGFLPEGFPGASRIELPRAPLTPGQTLSDTTLAALQGGTVVIQPSEAVRRDEPRARTQWVGSFVVLALLSLVMTSLVVHRRATAEAVNGPVGAVPRRPAPEAQAAPVEPGQFGATPSPAIPPAEHPGKLARDASAAAPEAADSAFVVSDSEKVPNPRSQAGVGAAGASAPRKGSVELSPSSRFGGRD
jgi:serine/threonine-protein kinase